MKKLKITFFICLALLIILPVRAVVFKTHKYTMLNGLPDNDVRTFVQDYRGYLWIGTMNGLSRFDGYSYHTYSPSSKGNNRFLLTNDIRELKSWRDRFLMIRQGIGLYSCFDVHKNCFVDYTGNGSYQSSYGRMMITSSDKLVLWDSKKGCKVITYKEGIFNSISYHIQSINPRIQLNNVEEDGNHRLWFCTNCGVFLAKGGKLLRKSTCDDMIKMVCDGSRTYFISSHGNLYQEGKNGKLRNILTGSEYGMKDALSASFIGNKMIIITKTWTLTYHTKKGKLEKAKELQAPGGNIFQDNMGNDIVADRTGMVWYFSRITGQIIPMKIYTKELLSAMKSYKYNVITAPDGNVWASAFGNGLFFYEMKTHQMTHITSKTDNGKIIDDNRVLSMMLDRLGNVWISSFVYGITCLKAVCSSESYVLINSDPVSVYNEIHMLTRLQDGRVLVGDLDGGLYEINKWHKLEKISQSEGNDCLSACIDPQGKLWLGTRFGGLTIGGVSYQHQNENRNSLGGNRVNNIVQDRRGRQWMALMENGVDLAISEGNGSYVFKHFFNDMKNVQFRYLLCDHRSRMWLVSTTGVYTFDADSLIRNPHAYHRVTIGANDNIEYRDIYEDCHHELWIGTRNHGAFMADNTKRQLKFRQIDVKKGLINNSIVSFTDDGYGNVLIFTSYGYSCYQPKSGVIFSLPLDNYNEHNCFWDHCVAMLPDGWIAAGTIGGIYLTNPINHQKGGSNQVNVSITKINIDGMPFTSHRADSLIQNYDEMKSIQLESGENNIRIDCSTFDFNNLENIKYSFFLESHDRCWSPITNDNSIVYQNLPPGKYIFHVRVYMNDNRTSEAERQLAIEIYPPIYFSWWAILSYLVMLVIIGSVAYHTLNTMNHLRNEVTVEKQLTEYKLRFFTNISHEFRTPLTIINGIMEKLQSQNQQGNLKAPIVAMRRSVNSMLRLVNQLLEFRKMQNDKLHLSLQKGNIIKFIHSVYDDFHEIADNKKITYTFASTIRDLEIYFDESHLDKILYNLLSNAFKYTPNGGTVDLSVNMVDTEILQIAVTDTGIGIPPEKRNALFTRFIHLGASPDSVGIGLNLSYELALNHHGKISYSPNPVGGSIFRLTLPTDKNVYAVDDFLSEKSELVSEEHTVQGFTETYQELSATPLNNQTILVVEDDTDVSSYLTDLLDEYFHVQTAIDGVDAMEKMKDHIPDLILTDMMMPRMNGIELIKKIRADGKLSQVPIILLTAVHDIEHEFKAIDQGADAYLAKPFSPKVLLSYCKRFLQVHNDLKITSKPVNNQILSVDKVSLKEIDRKFKAQVDFLIDKHLSNPEFTVADLSSIMRLGRTTIFERIKEVTGITPKAYMLERRMMMSVSLLEEGEMTVSEVSYRIGFSSPIYFTRVFKSRYGCTPSDFMRGKEALQKPTEQENN